MIRFQLPPGFDAAVNGRGKKITTNKHDERAMQMSAEAMKAELRGDSQRDDAIAIGAYRQQEAGIARGQARLSGGSFSARARWRETKSRHYVYSTSTLPAL